MMRKEYLVTAFQGNNIVGTFRITRITVKHIARTGWMRKRNILLTNWITRKEHGAYSLVDQEDAIILCIHFWMIRKEHDAYSLVDKEGTIILC
jgi:hypothetical protein